MTTDRECPCGTEAVRDQAALWFARSRDGDLPAPARASFEAWLAEHDQHAHEFRLLQNLWGAADLLPKARLEANLRLTRVFNSDDTDALLQALPSILPVAVRTLVDGSQEIFSQ